MQKRQKNNRISHEPATKADVFRIVRRETTEIKKNMATKNDIAKLATKKELGELTTKEELSELRKEMATKKELAELRKNMATKEELAKLRKEMATKQELAEMRKEMATKKELEDLAVMIHACFVTKEEFQSGFQKLEGIILDGQDRILHEIQSLRHENIANLAAHDRFENRFINIENRLNVRAQ